MLRWDDQADPNKCPQRWYAPIYGSGLRTTGTVIPGDEHFGYCYQPQTYSAPSHGFVTAIRLTRHGFNPDIQQADPDPRFNLGWHPYCATVEEAAQWLMDRGLIGQVMRYAHHKPVDQRGPFFDYDVTARERRWQQYCPWLTAGVVAHVTDVTGVIYGTIIGTDPNSPVFRIPAKGAPLEPQTS